MKPDLSAMESVPQRGSVWLGQLANEKCQMLYDQ